MIEEVAQVLRVVNGKATVEIQRQSACKGCELKGACGTGSLGRLLGFRQAPLELDGASGLKPGDRLVIGVAENAYLVAGFLIYLVPLVSLFLFALLAELWTGGGEAFTVTAALVGLGAGFVLSASLSRRFFSATLQAQIIRRLW